MRSIPKRTWKENPGKETKEGAADHGVGNLSDSVFNTRGGTNTGVGSETGENFTDFFARAG
jgi:hypothetical protein